MTDTPALLLASSSPFRRQLLDKLGLDFIHQSPDIDESPLAGESPREMVMRLALNKASALAGGFDAWRKQVLVEAIPAETPG